jgi:hypothetical protein
MGQDKSNYLSLKYPESYLFFIALFINDKTE